MSQNQQKIKIKNTKKTLDKKQISPFTINRRFSVAPMIDGADL